MLIKINKLKIKKIKSLIKWSVNNIINKNQSLTLKTKINDLVFFFNQTFEFVEALIKHEDIILLLII